MTAITLPLGSSLIWFGVIHLDDSFPGDREFGQLSIALGVVTLRVAGGIVLVNMQTRPANDLDQQAPTR